ncbi:MAG: TetR/AcrR family transcriptional regulator [Ottowia sp.]|uniref:TetR/AcrR family transcriptional regulator n=1 Tax=Ottowia sp. TaxID=1898956 RepID=UPI003C7817BE
MPSQHLDNDQIKTTKRYRQKREAILNAASQLFDKFGFKGTMLSEVANMVGLNTNSITYYWKRKEDLFFDCQLHTIKSLESVMVRAADCDTPEERIRYLIHAFVDMLFEIRAGRYPALTSLRDFQELDSTYTQPIFAAYRAMFFRARNLIAEGPLEPGKKMALSIRVYLLINQLQWSRMWLGALNPDSYTRLADHMADILLNGLSGSGAAWGPTPLDQRLAHIDVPELPNHGFVSTAINLINEVGFDGASIDRISARLNVTKGSFYHHITSKEELFADCIRRTNSVVDAMQKMTLQSPENGFEKLCALSRAMVTFHFSPRGPLLRTSTWSELSNYTQFHNRVEPVRAFIQNVTDLFAAGMIDGSIRPTHQQVAATMMVGMVSGATTLDKWVPGSENTEATELFVRPFFEGICCPI